MIKVPYVQGGLHLATGLWASFAGAELVCLDGESDIAYHEVLCQWWAEPGDLVIVEQDVVPADGVVEEMLACPYGWCVSPYPLRPGHTASRTISWDLVLGCTAFTHELRRRHPDVMQLAGVPGEHEVEPPGVWWMIDVRLACQLLRVGELAHAHRASRHLHPPQAYQEVA